MKRCQTPFVGMYDLIGHFVYLKLYGGFIYEGRRKRNKTQAADEHDSGPLLEFVRS